MLYEVITVNIFNILSLYVLLIVFRGEAMLVEYIKFYFEKDGNIWEKIVQNKDCIETLDIIRDAVMLDGYKLIKWEEWLSEEHV